MAHKHNICIITPRASSHLFVDAYCILVGCWTLNALVVGIRWLLFFFCHGHRVCPGELYVLDKSPGPPLGFDGQEFQFCWSEQTRPRDYLGLTNDCLLVATHDNYCELYVLTSKTVELRRCQDMRCISRTAPIDHVRPGGDLGRLPRLPASRLKEHLCSSC